jgi:hypothetical protein
VDDAVRGPLHLVPALHPCHSPHCVFGILLRQGLQSDSLVLHMAISQSAFVLRTNWGVKWGDVVSSWS